jgi:hypothetical protein
MATESKRSTRSTVRALVQDTAISAPEWSPEQNALILEQRAAGRSFMHIGKELKRPARDVRAQHGILVKATGDSTPSVETPTESAVDKDNPLPVTTQESAVDATLPETKKRKADKSPDDDADTAQDTTESSAWQKDVRRRLGEAASSEVKPAEPTEMKPVVPADDAVSPPADLLTSANSSSSATPHMANGEIVSPSGVTVGRFSIIDTEANK